MLGLLVFGALGITWIIEIYFLCKFIKMDIEKSKELQEEIRKSHKEIIEIDKRLTDLMNNKNIMTEEEFDVYLEELIKNSNN